MEKDKLLDYMYDQNRRLTDQLAGVSEELRLQREQADRNFKDLKSSLGRMEERAVAAEKRADMEAEARAKAEQQVAALTKAIESLTNGSAIRNLEQQVIDLTKEREDAKASDKHNSAERKGQHAPHENGTQC